MITSKNVANRENPALTSLKPHPVEISLEEQEVLDLYRRAKSLGFADILISIQEGVRVKLWLTEKRK